MTEAEKIKEQVEEKLQAQQAHKQFKDVGRVAQTRKEKSAYKLISGQILNQLEEDSVMAYNMVKKENVWVEIDVATERQRGTTSGATYLKVKIREAAPTRPKDDKAKRATYVLFLELIQKDLLECYTVVQIKELLNKYREFPLDKVIGYFINPAYLTASEDEKKLIDEKLKQNTNIRVAMIYGSRALTMKLTNEVFGARFENILWSKSDAALAIWQDAAKKEPITAEESTLALEKLLKRRADFTDANNKLLEGYRAMDGKGLRLDMETKWTIGSESKKEYRKDIEQFRTFVISYYERRIKNENVRFDEKEKELQPKPNDWSWIDLPEIKDEVKKPKSEAINTKPPLSYIKRTGGYKIETNTPQQIIDAFGFSAVNYGVYVDDKWSKEHTSHFLGAICDMGEMLNIDIKKVNQLGKLSIAFGAKGRKGHAAAYFPQTKDINLTKGNGDGSVAHEWGHYFDNVIVELDLKRATNNFASENGSSDIAIADLFKELMTFFYKGNELYTPKVPMLFYAKKADKAPSFSVRSNNGWDSKPIEIKSTIEETFEQVKHFMMVEKDYHATQVRLFGYIIDAFGLETYAVPMKLKTSYVFHKSAYGVFTYCFKTVKGIEIAVMPRTRYWSSAVELFARAWETVILKKIIDKGRASNYLVDNIPMEDIVSESYFAPYPAGKELEYIETIIDKIILAVKTRFNIGDFVAPSTIKEDEYIDLQNNNTGKTDKAMVVETKPEGDEVVEFISEDKIVKVIEEPKKEQMENTHLSYIDAMKPPKGGAVAAGADNLNAWFAEMIAKKHAMRPQAIYDWATKHNIILQDRLYLMDAAKWNAALLNDVLNDINFETQVKVHGREDVKEGVAKKSELTIGLNMGDEGMWNGAEVRITGFDEIGNVVVKEMDEAGKETKVSIESFKKHFAKFPVDEAGIISSAIQDVLTIPEVGSEYKLKYGNLDLAEAKVLYSLSGKEFEQGSWNDPTTLKEEIMQSLEKMGYAEYIENDKSILTPLGNEFVDAVNNRVETIKGIRAGVDLFPEEAGVIHEPERIYHDIKSCLLGEGDDQEIYLFEGKEFINSKSGSNERWKIISFYKYGMNVEHVPHNKLITKKPNVKLSFKELRDLFVNKDIEIYGVADIKALDHCLKILIKCIDAVDTNEALEAETKSHASTKQVLKQKEDAEKLELARIGKEVADKKERDAADAAELKRIEAESLRNAYDALILLAEITEGEEKQKSLDAIEALKIVMGIEEPVDPLISFIKEGEQKFAGEVAQQEEFEKFIAQPFKDKFNVAYDSRYEHMYVPDRKAFVDEQRQKFGAEQFDEKMAVGGFVVDKKYTHFAVRKSDGKIATGWNYKKVDKEDIKTFTKMDLRDTELNPADFKIVTGEALISRGVNPFDWANWRDFKDVNEYNTGGKIEKVMGEFKAGELKTPQGEVVRKRKQAVAIAMSEARAVGQIK